MIQSKKRINFTAILFVMILLLSIESSLFASNWNNLYIQGVGVSTDFSASNDKSDPNSRLK